jgi:hypothetical protein
MGPGRPRFAPNLSAVTTHRSFFTVTHLQPFVPVYSAPKLSRLISTAARWA